MGRVNRSRLFLTIMLCERVDRDLSAFSAQGQDVLLKLAVICSASAAKAFGLR